MLRISRLSSSSIFSLPAFVALCLHDPEFWGFPFFPIVVEFYLAAG